jgi:hypothetical protein
MVDAHPEGSDEEGLKIDLVKGAPRPTPVAVGAEGSEEEAPAAEPEASEPPPAEKAE